jgi:hypothetical protein
MQIGMAHATGFYFDQNFAGAERWPLDFFE